MTHILTVQALWLAGQKVAEALSLNYVFLCEFEELHSPKRKPVDQVLWKATLRMLKTITCNTCACPENKVQECCDT